MSSRTLKLLAVGVVALFAVVFLMNRNGDGSAGSSAPLLPALKGAINDIEAVSITGADGTVTIRSEDGRWIVPEKHGYPADTATLRSLLLALADASRIEQKTANPELYEHLGVGDPGDVAGGVLVEATGEGLAEPIAVILGDAAQGDYRYARLPTEEASWLIDRNPEVPEAAADWLLQEIVDIPPTDIRSARIRHADGETIRIRKESADETNYQLVDVPEGREPSYPSVANPIAGVLSNLQLEDVRPAAASGDAEPSATASLTTFGGLVIDLDVWREEPDEAAGDEATPAVWVALEASASEPAEDDGEAPTPDPAAEGPADADTDEAADPAAEPPATAAGETESPDPREQAAAINERVAGWQYRLPDYKARQLTRRREDLLKAAEAEE